MFALGPLVSFVRRTIELQSLGLGRFGKQMAQNLDDLDPTRATLPVLANG